MKYCVFRTCVADTANIYARINEAIWIVVKGMLICKCAELDYWFAVISATGFPIVEVTKAHTLVFSCVKVIED
jgi:hypothetical protein